jgi:hypothetical protein
MEIRFYEDPDTGRPHIYGHDVTEDEVVITAYELRGKAKTAYRRRQRRKSR